MTVQELIDVLTKIEDKSSKVFQLDEVQQQLNEDDDENDETDESQWQEVQRTNIAIDPIAKEVLFFIN